MLETLIHFGVSYYLLGIVVLVGVVAKFISSFTTRKIVRAAGEIQKSEHELMRLIKAKFEHASMVSDRVQNVEVFVKKYLYEYRVFGKRLERWRALPAKMLWLAAAISLLGSGACFWEYGIGEEFFRVIVVGAAGAVFLWSIQLLGDEASRMEATRTYIVDYLENVCVRRYERMRRGQEDEAAKVDAEQAESKAELVDVKSIAEEVATATPEESAQEVCKDTASLQQELEAERKEQELRIRAILQEFLA
ncbi:MAG: hypothetical protein UHS49_02795 [Faecalimonas sp.]|nr:hypothetical protein [Faecalimonas sp.]